MVGGKADPIGIVAPEDRSMHALDTARDEHNRQAIVFGKLDILGRRADSRRHDDAIRTKLQKRVHEGALFVQLVIMVGQDESLARTVELGFDGFENFREKRVHDVPHDDADNARTRGTKARRPAVIDITDGARMFLDLLTGLVGNQRTIAQCQRNGGGRNTERVSDGRGA